MRILVADDDRAWVELLATRLRTRGHQVTVAYDAAQAMMGAMRTVPDLVLLDVRMPGGNGLDTLRKLKMSTKTGLLPVIVITAQEGENVHGEAIKAGAAAFVRKPARFEDVYRQVTSVLGLQPEGD